MISAHLTQPLGYYSDYYPRDDMHERGILLSKGVCLSLPGIVSPLTH